MATEAHQRVAIIDGVRTPFVKAWTVYKDQSAADLGRFCVRELVARNPQAEALTDEVVMGVVAAPSVGPNVAREVVLRSGLRREIPAYCVQMYCASSALAVANAAGDIASGMADVVVAGGVESTSSVQALVSRELTHALNDLSKARTMQGRLKALAHLSAQDLAPQAPGLVEATTGLSMGESAERMTKRFGVTREEQDAFALASHQRAHDAFESGRYDRQVMTVYAGDDGYTPIERDNTVRGDTSMEKMAKLRPVFDRKRGTVTAANASPLTDGAAAVLVARGSTAREQGWEPMAYIRASASAALDLHKLPMLLGPSFATPIALKRAGMTLADIDLIEMHEAFAGQVLSNLRVWSSDALAREVGLDGAIGEPDMDLFNVNGGSIAVGHPFGATGARLVMNAAQELVRRDLNTALVTLCAAGGLGFAIVLERA